MKTRPKLEKNLQLPFQVSYCSVLLLGSWMFSQSPSNLALHLHLSPHTIRHWFIDVSIFPFFTFTYIFNRLWYHTVDLGAVSFFALSSLCFWEAACCSRGTRTRCSLMSVFTFYLDTGSAEAHTSDQFKHFDWLDWLEGGTEGGPGLGVFLFRETGI